MPARAARPRVVCTRRLTAVTLRELDALFDLDLHDSESPIPRAELLERVRRADGLLAMLNDRVDAELLAAAHRLRVIANFAVGVDNVDVDAATARGILVSNT